jgi:hypothetical protein
MIERMGAAPRAEREWRVRAALLNGVPLAAGWVLLVLLSNGAIPLPALVLAIGVVLLVAGLASAVAAAVWCLRGRSARRGSRRRPARCAESQRAACDRGVADL